MPRGDIESTTASVIAQAMLNKTPVVKAGKEGEPLITGTEDPLNL